MHPSLVGLLLDEVVVFPFFFLAALIPAKVAGLSDFLRLAEALAMYKIEAKTIAQAK
jgi:hypothetical protein